MKLLDIVPANDGIHKYKAIFLQDSGRKKTTKFGAKGYKDFIEYNKTGGGFAAKHKELYLARHKTTESWNNPITAGSLSRWILWNKPTLQESEKDFRQRFDL